MYSETLSGPQSRNKFSWEIQLGTSVDVTKAKAFSCCVLAIEFWDFFWPSGTVSVHLRMIVMHNSNRSLPTEFDAKYRRYQRKKFKFPVLLLSSVGRVRIWGTEQGDGKGGALDFRLFFTNCHLLATSNFQINFITKTSKLHTLLTYNYHFTQCFALQKFFDHTWQNW